MIQLIWFVAAEIDDYRFDIYQNKFQFIIYWKAANVLY